MKDLGMNADLLVKEPTSVHFNAQDRIEQLRAVTGRVSSDDPLVHFLYLLMRDHLPTGVVEKLVQVGSSHPSSLYTNGWLAKYAENLAGLLKEGKHD